MKDLRTLADEALEARLDLTSHRELTAEERAQCLAVVLLIDDYELGDIDHPHETYLRVKKLLRIAVAASHKDDRDYMVAAAALGRALVDMARSTASGELDRRIIEAKQNAHDAYLGGQRECMQEARIDALREAYPELDAMRAGLMALTAKGEAA